MEEIALGTKLFSRTLQLHQLLTTLPEGIFSEVYVAHDGEWDEEKEEILNQDYDVDLTILDMEFDAGLSAGRNQVIDASTEEYLLFVDTDHRVPTRVTELFEQIQNSPAIGGIAGSIIEPESARLWQSAKDFSESGGGLVRDASGDRRIEHVAGGPLARFDFIPNTVLFRRECLDDYRWDENYIIGSEHVDFYIGHWKQTDWEFAVNPTVFFEHYPGGSESYMTSRHGSKVEQSRDYLLSKWKYDFVRDREPYWFDTQVPPLPVATRRAISQQIPDALYGTAKRLYDQIRRL